MEFKLAEKLKVRKKEKKKRKRKPTVPVDPAAAQLVIIELIHLEVTASFFEKEDFNAIADFSTTLNLLNAYKSNCAPHNKHDVGNN